MLHAQVSSQVSGYSPVGKMAGSAAIIGICRKTGGQRCAAREGGRVCAKCRCTRVHGRCSGIARTIQVGQ